MTESRERRPLKAGVHDAQGAFLCRSPRGRFLHQESAEEDTRRLQLDEIIGFVGNTIPETGKSLSAGQLTSIREENPEGEKIAGARQIKV